MSWKLALLAFVILIAAVVLLDTYVLRRRKRPLSATKPTAGSVAIEARKMALVSSQGAVVYEPSTALGKQLREERIDAAKHRQSKASRDETEKLQEKRSRVRPWDNT